MHVLNRHGTLITIITKIEQLKQNSYKYTRLKQTRTLITIITKIEQLKQNNYKYTRLKQTRNTDNNYY